MKNLSNNQYAIVPFMGLGFQDGLSPFLLIIAIIFILLLSFFTKSNRGVLINGIYYFIGSYLLLASIFIGVVDRAPQILLNPILFQLVYGIIALVILVFARFEKI